MPRDLNDHLQPLAAIYSFGHSRQPITFQGKVT